MNDDVHNRNYERPITDAMNKRKEDGLIQFQFPVMNEEEFKAYAQDKNREASGDPRLTEADLEVMCAIHTICHQELYETHHEYKAGEATQ